MVSRMGMGRGGVAGDTKAPTISKHDFGRNRYQFIRSLLHLDPIFRKYRENKPNFCYNQNNNSLSQRIYF